MSLEREGHGKRMFARSVPLLTLSPTRIIGGPISQCLSSGACMACVMYVVDDWKEGDRRGGGKSSRSVRLFVGISLSCHHYPLCSE